MGPLVVWNLDDRDIDALRVRAARQEQSLEAESRLILERAAERFIDVAEARAPGREDQPLSGGAARISTAPP